MSDLLKHLEADLSGFDNQITDLRGRKEILAKEIDDLDSNIKTIEPLKAYVSGLLDRIKTPTATTPAKKAKAQNAVPLA